MAGTVSPAPRPESRSVANEVVTTSATDAAASIHQGSGRAGRGPITRTSVQGVRRRRPSDPRDCSLGAMSFHRSRSGTISSGSAAASSSSARSACSCGAAPFALHQVAPDVPLFAGRQVAAHEVVQQLQNLFVCHRPSASLSSLRARCSCALLVPTAEPCISAISSCL